MSIAYDPAGQGKLYYLLESGDVKVIDFETGTIEKVTSEVTDSDKLKFANG